MAPAAGGSFVLITAMDVVDISFDPPARSSLHGPVCSLREHPRIRSLLFPDFSLWDPLPSGSRDASARRTPEALMSPSSLDLAGRSLAPHVPSLRRSAATSLPSRAVAARKNLRASGSRPYLPPPARTLFAPDYSFEEADFPAGPRSSPTPSTSLYSFFL